MTNAQACLFISWRIYSCSIQRNSGEIRIALRDSWVLSSRSVRVWIYVWAGARDLKRILRIPHRFCCCYCRENARLVPLVLQVLLLLLQLCGESWPSEKKRQKKKEKKSWACSPKCFPGAFLAIPTPARHSGDSRVEEREGVSSKQRTLSFLFNILWLLFRYISFLLLSIANISSRSFFFSFEFLSLVAFFFTSFARLLLRFLTKNVFYFACDYKDCS